MNFLVKALLIMAASHLLTCGFLVNQMNAHVLLKRLLGSTEDE